MRPWRIIHEKPADGPWQMALDEALFAALCDDPSRGSTFRLYTWKTPCITIGYFQKYRQFAGRGMPVIRRLTGGLSVRHGDDISYSMVTTEADWPHIYDQEETYKMLHSGIRQGLARLGINAEFSKTECATSRAENTRDGSSVCVETVFEHDLHLQGRKIAGSSQRRRGKTLLVQGTLHISPENVDLKQLSEAIRRGWEETLKIAITQSGPSAEELDSMKLLLSKYCSADWNNRF